jgi:hypothetical protein
MYCPGCGKKIEVGYHFCPYCDRRLSESTAAGGSRDAAGAAVGTPEQVLFTFGPFGMDVCNGPYRIFKTWHRRNSVIVELTDRRLCALPNRRFGLLTIPAMKYPWGVRLPFEIPYTSIVSMDLNPHPSPIALMEVLDIKYREGGTLLEKSIASYKNSVRRAYQIITAARQASA